VLLFTSFVVVDPGSLVGGWVTLSRIRSLTLQTSYFGSVCTQQPEEVTPSNGKRDWIYMYSVGPRLDRYFHIIYFYLFVSLTSHEGAR